MPYFVVELDYDQCPRAMQLLVQNGYHNIALMPSLWDHPELRYTAPPQQFLERLMQPSDASQSPARDHNGHDDNDLIVGQSEATTSAHPKLSISSMGSHPLTIKKEIEEDDYVKCQSNSVPLAVVRRMPDQPVASTSFHTNDGESDDDADILSRKTSIMDSLVQLASKSTSDISDDNDLSGINRRRRHTLNCLSPNGTVVRKRIKRGTDYFCALCDKLVVSSAKGTWNFLIHVQLAHSKVKPFKCAASDCQFQHMRSLVKRHMEDIHPELKEQPIDQRTCELNDEWRLMVQRCFPSYFENNGYHVGD